MNMKMNNAPEIVLNESEKKIITQKLMILLSAKIRRFTQGNSSSIPAEMADELMKSICYTLNISLENPNEKWKALLNKNLELELKVGLKNIETKIVYAKKLCTTLINNLPPVTSTSMVDTLKSIDSSWNAYDYQFFAHLFPCSIDYQLAIPVPETIQGVEYITRYLTHLFLENLILSHYKSDEITTLLNLYSKDFKELPLNLFEPVVTNAIGLAVLDKYDSLIITSNQLSELYKTFENMRKPKIYETLCNASDKLIIPFTSNKKAISDYLHYYCKDLTSRVSSMCDCNGLNGIFLVCDI